jgi:SecD/SecF fusion protein
MDKSLTWKIVLITVLVIIAVLVLYPPNKTLKPGIDLAGGTSLIYQIDVQGLDESEKKDLSSRMITVLRRRIDPANIQNLVWRPQGNTRFEIQMPLSSAEARQKRQDYERSLDELLSSNVNPALIMRSLKKPAAERTKDFEKFAQNIPDKLTILNNLAAAYDERKSLQEQRGNLAAKLKTQEASIASASLDIDNIKLGVGGWITLNEQQLAKTLKELPGAEKHLELLNGYVKTYADWANVVEQLTAPEKGKNEQYQNARRALDKLSLTAEQINAVLVLPPKSVKRNQALEQLKTEFPDRAEKIDKKLVKAFDEYSPYQGRLDDPKDLQRMLKGAGILEFRILPTVGHPDSDTDLMNHYVETLKTKGPKFASDNKYVWCEIENKDEWKRKDVFTAPFGNKLYVLASNKVNEVMLHNPKEKDWTLKKSQPQTDREGRRAIGFTLDERGGRLFSNITGRNIDRPLCILLDGIAISAPTVQSRISTSGIITGSFTQEEVVDMVNKLNAGSLPARLVEQPISVKTIGPLIGADNRDKGILSGIIGLIGVLSCMAVYYIIGGCIADAALLMNLLFTLAIMALLRATFTLPGIAGLVLTIGMSVDANVLIFERMREELQKGSSLRMAVRNGYQRAFSAIFDSNVTTVISAAILYWVASEEIKGFALVLMLGLASSMFTALFVTRVVFDYLLDKKILKDRFVMLHLIKKPNINWMSFRPAFFTLSAILTVGGLAIFFTRDETKNSKYDIEFTGGTSIQINLKKDVNLTREDVENRIRQTGEKLGDRAIAAANIYAVEKTGRQYEITTTETNKVTATVTFPQSERQNIESITSAIQKAEQHSSGRLDNLSVVQDAKNPAVFTITTNQTNRPLVKEILTTAFAKTEISEPKLDEVVNNAVLTAFANELEIWQNLRPKVVSTEKITEQFVNSYPELSDFLGGIKILCEVEKPATGEEIIQRINDLRFKPDMQNLNWYNWKILSADLTALDPARPVKSFVYISTQPEAAFRELTEDEWTQFTENEKTKVTAAAEIETSLPRVTQIAPSVGSEAKTQALIAIILSLFALLVYIWVRFGNLRYGLGAVITVFHDTCVTLGAVTVCTYIAMTFIGEKLLIGDFKIDMVIIAAFLTLIGYSLNDTIVVYDRIRENRPKAGLTPQIINNSINETLSRTLLTGVTTFLVVLVMYIFGGASLRGFNFTMVFGIIIGTYSSIAISAPILLLGTKAKKEEK